MRNRLSLGELRSATSGLQTVLLSLLHSGVTGQETGGLQSGAILGIQGQQGTGNAVTDSAGLAGNAAAGNGDNDVDLANQISGDRCCGAYPDAEVFRTPDFGTFL